MQNDDDLVPGYAQRNVHRWGRVTFDLDREIITWPNGTQSQFRRYATKRLPTDPAPRATDLFRFKGHWAPSSIRSAVFQVPRKDRSAFDYMPTWAALLVIAAVIALCSVILAAI